MRRVQVHMGLLLLLRVRVLLWGQGVGRHALRRVLQEHGVLLVWVHGHVGVGVLQLLHGEKVHAIAAAHAANEG